MFQESFTVSGSSLKLLKPGERGVVTRLRSVDDNVAQKLRRFGIAPGASVTLEQRFPRFVVKVGTNRVALDDRTIAAIYVRTGGSVSSMMPMGAKQLVEAQR
jgi:ferrous iron transport protein A